MTLGNSVPLWAEEAKSTHPALFTRLWPDSKETAGMKCSLQATGSNQTSILLYHYKVAPGPGPMVQKVIPVRGWVEEVLLVDGLPHGGKCNFKGSCIYLSERMLTSPPPKMDTSRSKRTERTKSKSGLSGLEPHVCRPSHDLEWVTSVLGGSISPSINCGLRITSLEVAFKF